MTAYELLETKMNEIKEQGHEILYLVKFGSHLYGTATPSSDQDFKGLFLPSKKSCLLNKAPKHFSFNSKKGDQKNSSEDVDVQFWSLQYWLELVAKGETNALDLLYSHTYPEMIVYQDSRMQRLFRQHQSLFTASASNSYCGYAIGQARKYGVKGSRVGVLKRVKERFDLRVRVCSVSPHVQPCLISMGRLKDCVESLLLFCKDDSYCFTKVLTGSNGQEKPFLVLCGAKHDLDITIEEFYGRVKSTYEEYGKRAIKAEQNDGLDYKALSHAVRALDQMTEILESGGLRYPLATADKLTKIKRGEYTWEQIEQMIQQGLDEVDRLKIRSSFHQLDPTLADDLIMGMY